MGPSRVVMPAPLLNEDEDTGMQRYRYIRAGADHFSLAFTYAWLAASDYSGGRGLMRWMRSEVRKLEAGGGDARRS